MLSNLQHTVSHEMTELQMHYNEAASSCIPTAFGALGNSHLPVHVINLDAKQLLMSKFQRVQKELYAQILLKEMRV